MGFVDILSSLTSLVPQRLLELSPAAAFLLGTIMLLPLLGLIGVLMYHQVRMRQLRAEWMHKRGYTFLREHRWPITRYFTWPDPIKRRFNPFTNRVCCIRATATNGLTLDLWLILYPFRFDRRKVFVYSDHEPLPHRRAGSIQ